MVMHTEHNRKAKYKGLCVAEILCTTQLHDHIFRIYKRDLCFVQTYITKKPLFALFFMLPNLWSNKDIKFCG